MNLLNGRNHMNDSPTAVRLPSQDESIAPVTILDGQGSVVQVMPAAEFRRLHPLAGDYGHARTARRRERHRAESPSLV
jgi:hypothetical protein